jgi:hypothetical protein
MSIAPSAWQIVPLADQGRLVDDSACFGDAPNLRVLGRDELRSLLRAVLLVG